MAEVERTRERERGTIPETPYEIFIRSRREFLERQETGQVVVKPSDREFYITRQGRRPFAAADQAGRRRASALQHRSGLGVPLDRVLLYAVLRPCGVGVHPDR